MEEEEEEEEEEVSDLSPALPLKGRGMFHQVWNDKFQAKNRVL